MSRQQPRGSRHLIPVILAVLVVAAGSCGSDQEPVVDTETETTVTDGVPADDGAPAEPEPADDPAPSDPDDPAATEDPDPPADDAPDPAAGDDPEPDPDADQAEPAPDPADDEPAASIIDDGRHPAYLTAIDLDAGTITIDVIQFLTGDEAIAAYREDEPGDPDGVPPNDYHIRNVNPLLRTLPVAPAVTVTIVTPEAGTGAEPVASSFAALPAHLATHGAPPGRLGWNPFWITVEDDVVRAIEEQFLP